MSFTFSGFKRQLSFIQTPIGINVSTNTNRLSSVQQCRLSKRSSLKVSASADKYTTVLTIPTGIGASIGGYAGDALPIVRLVSSIADTVITHPNVLNGALMYWPIQNALYVEGYALDQFAAGNCALKCTSKKSNRIGLVLDAAMDHEAITRHIQAAEAARATLGLQVTGFNITDQPLNVNLANSISGASWGQITNAESLLEASASQIANGCQAIAVVTRFPDDEDEDQLAQYRAGNAVDAIAGAEAVISHLVTRELSVPCAHAPSLTPLNVDESVAPKAAAEELGYTFLSCVLVGLSKAPHLVPTSAWGVHLQTDNTIIANQVDSMIVPADSFGGSAVMNLGSNRDILIVAVTENVTALNVSSQLVGVNPAKVLYARSYAEAAGYIAAHKAGVDILSLGSFVPQLGHVPHRQSTSPNFVR